MFIFSVFISKVLNMGVLKYDDIYICKYAIWRRPCFIPAGNQVKCMDFASDCFVFLYLTVYLESLRLRYKYIKK